VLLLLPQAETFCRVKEGANYEVFEDSLEQNLNKCDQSELLMLLGLRSLELFAEISLGRNQNTLGLILRNSDFSVQYPQILQAMFSNAIPIAFRARYVKLMQRLYLDRDPQTSKPQVPIGCIHSKPLVLIYGICIHSKPLVLIYGICIHSKPIVSIYGRNQPSLRAQAPNPKP
jgi:hypothetical protein